MQDKLVFPARLLPVTFYLFIFIGTFKINYT